ncbi:MAG: hypothetical protein CM15mP92_2680 [Halieaceae bacterium]|nr:MAG: hypothetical protein CM15mP92_2680 [Halieaceae bacterium]
MFETVEIDGEPLKIPAILPKLSETPGAPTGPAPRSATTTARYWETCWVCQRRTLLTSRPMA